MYDRVELQSFPLVQDFAAPVDDELEMSCEKFLPTVQFDVLLQLSFYFLFALQFRCRGAVVSPRRPNHRHSDDYRYENRSQRHCPENRRKRDYTMRVRACWYTVSVETSFPRTRITNYSLHLHLTRMTPNNVRVGTRGIYRTCYLCEPGTTYKIFPQRNGVRDRSVR